MNKLHIISVLSVTLLATLSLSRAFMAPTKLTSQARLKDKGSYLMIKDNEITHSNEANQATIFLIEEDFNQVTPTAIGHENRSSTISFENKYLTVADQKLILGNSPSYWKTKIGIHGLVPNQIAPVRAPLITTQHNYHLLVEPA